MGSSTRRIPACSSSRRELWPTRSNVLLSREPWKRSIRRRSSSSGSLVVTAPPSPKQRRFFDGKNENVASVPSEPGRPASVERAGGLRGVLDDRDAERLDLRDRRDVAEQVHGEHRARRGRERGAHGLGRHARGLRVDVAEHRAGARVDDRLGGRVEGERRDDDVVAGADAERAQRDRDRVGAVGDADGVPRAEVGRELVLERGDLGAEDERPAVEHLGELRVDLPAQRIERRLGVEQRDRHHVQRRSRKFPGAWTLAPPCRKPL